MSTKTLAHAFGHEARRQGQAAPSELIILADVIRTVVRHHRLRPEDADDFKQSVHLKLLDRNYDVFDRFAGRSSLRTYLTVVVVRLLLDWRNSRFGKWRPSAEARRLGMEAIELERLMSRDGLSAHQAVTSVASRTGASVEWLETLRHSLPVRLSRRFVPATAADDAGGSAFDDPIEQAEQQDGDRRVRMALREALERLSDEDRLILRHRFSAGLTVRSASQTLAAEPKRVYRRLQQILLRLRADLAQRGIAGRERLLNEQSRR